MKKCLLFLLSMVAASAIAQTAPNATISGHSISLASKSFMFASRNNVIKRQIPVDVAGDFKISLVADSGYYSLPGRQVYMQPGYTLAINITDTVYTFTGKGAKENILLKQLNPLIRGFVPLNQPGKLYELEPEDFLSRLDAYKIKVDQLLDAPGLAPYFKRTQKQRAEYNTRFVINEYALNYGVDSIKRKEFTALILKQPRPTAAEILAANEAMHTKRLSIEQRNTLNTKLWGNFDMNNEELYKASAEYVFLHDQKMTMIYTAERTKDPSLNSKTPNELKRDLVAANITNSYIKEYLYYKYTSALMAASKGTGNYYNDYLKLAKDPLFIAEINKAYALQKMLLPGELSPDFNLKNTTNQLVNLDSFKGKYVYIDVWATWCGPCIAEIPALKQIEKKYDGNNIAFVSISIDNLNDTQKWKYFVKTNSLAGTQLIAENAGNSAFATQYAIATIPRFILLDPDGRIVSSDALRPSNPALQKQLDGLLFKN